MDYFALDKNDQLNKERERESEKKDTGYERSLPIARVHTAK